MLSPESLILPGVLLVLLYFRAPVFLWTVTFGLVLLAVTFFGRSSLFYLILCWLCFLTAVLFSYSQTIRQRFITGPLIRRLQERMPPMSQTEREAIDAGDVFWEKELFCGRPKWKKLLAMPAPALKRAEQEFLDNQVNTLCDMLDDWAIMNNQRDLPIEVWEFLKRERFFGLIIPEIYGGKEFSALGNSSIVAKIATRSVSAAVTVMVPNSLGPGELLLHYGTEAQKSWYLPRLARGEDIPCFALTAPNAGSDAGSITDSGVVCQGEFEGKHITGIRLNFDKRYITLAPVATVVGLAVRLSDPENLLGKGTEPGITLCLVPASHPGVETGHRHDPLGLAFMNGPVRGKDVFVPLDWIIGGPEMAGEGWRMLMECLSMGRGISLPALSAAQGQLAYRFTGAYARLRRQFNMPIAAFEGVAESLGHIAGNAYLLEACRLLTVGAIDQKIRPAIASAIAKYHMTELQRHTVMHAMDVHAGHGIQRGPRNVLAQGYMSLPVSITVEGANLLTRNLIIFGQGAIRCHPFLLQEVEQFTAAPSLARTKHLDRLLFSHVGYFLSLVVRNTWCGLTGGKLLSVAVPKKLAAYTRQITRMSSALALLSDVSFMMLGGELKRKERLSARLGDMLSQLYLASAVIKYFHDQGQPETDEPYFQWCMQTCLAEIQIACDDLLDNFPHGFFASLLRFILFPFGRAYKKPRDRLHHRIAVLMQQPSVLRDRLTSLFYISQSASDPVRQMENALLQVAKVEPIIKKYQQALRSGKIQSSIEEAVAKKIISQEEAECLQTFDTLYQEIIRVDEFSFNFDSVLTGEKTAWKKMEKQTV